MAGDLDETGLELFLRGAAAQHDRDAAIDRLDKLVDPSLRARAGQVLGDLLVNGAPREAEFAGGLSQMYPLVPAGALAAGLRRPDLPTVGSPAFAVGAALRDAVLSGRAPYDDSLRQFAARADLDGVLTPVYVVFDHGWFLDHLKTVLSDDVYQADFRLRSSVETWGEAERVLDELRARRAEVGDAVVDAFIRSVQEFFPAPKDDADRKIRWAP
jgi:hypothetical protein